MPRLLMNRLDTAAVQTVAFTKGAASARITQSPHQDQILGVAADNSASAAQKKIEPNSPIRRGPSRSIALPTKGDRVTAKKAAMVGPEDISARLQPNSA
jgi:hypothetical protein